MALEYSGNYFTGKYKLDPDSADAVIKLASIMSETQSSSTSGLSSDVPHDYGRKWIYELIRDGGGK